MSKRATAASALVWAHHLPLEANNHAVVIPLHGDLPLDWTSWVASLLAVGVLIVLLENNREPFADRYFPLLQYTQSLDGPACICSATTTKPEWPEVSIGA